MATSPIFGWPEPDDTSLVKDGALAMRTLGNAIDTTMNTKLTKFTANMSGAILTFQGERNGNPAVNSYYGMGNGATLSNMAAPVSGKLIYATLAIDAPTADANTSVTTQFSKNYVAQGTGYQLTVTAGTQNVQIGNYFSTPLSIAAGDQINWIVTAVGLPPTVTLQSRTVVTWYIRCD